MNCHKMLVFELNLRLVPLSIFTLLSQCQSVRVSQCHMLSDELVLVIRMRREIETSIGHTNDRVDLSQRVRAEIDQKCGRGETGLV